MLQFRGFQHCLRRVWALSKRFQGRFHRAGRSRTELGRGQEPVDALVMGTNVVMLGTKRNR